MTLGVNILNVMGKKHTIEIDFYFFFGLVSVFKKKDKF